MQKRAGYDGGKIAGLYDLEATLGSGHFAVVKLARHVFTGEKVAVKVIDKTKLDEVSRAHLFQEVRCMKLVQHPNVVRLYEVIDTQTKLYLILELGDGGDLYDYIMRHDAGLSETLAREYFQQIVRAISYCHKLHVVHRDLKPENVVFFETTGTVKLTDFGFSNRFCPGQKLETSCGSLAYSAPEILLGDSYDAPAVDVWSLGVILYMLVCGAAPFQEANDSETLTMIMDCKYTVPPHVSQPCRRLIARMLVREPEHRATLEQIAADPWLAEDEVEGVDGGVGGGEGSDTALSVPLVSRQQLTEDDHAFIVQKMVNGKIAAKEEILDALDKNEYNHITATYFLLAERKLRALEPKQLLRTPGKKPPCVQVDPCDLGGGGEHGATKGTVVVGPGALGLCTPTERGRKCSVVAEEEDDEEDRGSCGSHSSLNRRGSRSEGKLHLAVQELRREAHERGMPTVTVITEASTAPGPLNPSPHSTPRPAKTLPAALPTALSSPQIGLGEISEEGSGGQGSRGGATPAPARFTAYEQRRTKFHKTRTASCSSSDASDEDSESRKKRGGSNKSLHRGRDPQDPGGSSGGGSGGAAPPPGGGSTGGTGGGFPSRGEGGPDAGGLGGKGEGGHRGGHRHRRRAGETRLRESQSLNRITEVQEADPPPPPPPPTASPKCNKSVGANDRPTTEPTEVRKHHSKRHALIGRYLSLQRKLCLPLWGRSSTKVDRGGELGSAAVAVAASIGMCHLPLQPADDAKCCRRC